MVSQNTKEEVLRSIMNREENKACFDCLASGPKWASLTYGILLCDQCAQEHRNLGITLSFVRGLEESDWTVKQLKSLTEGGNKALEDFFNTYQIARTAPISFKYRTKAAEYYRGRTKKLSAGDRPDSEPPELVLGQTIVTEEEVIGQPSEPPTVEPGLIDNVTEYLGTVWTSVGTKSDAVYESVNELTKRPTVKKVEEKALSALFYLESWFHRAAPPTADQDPRQIS